MNNIQHISDGVDNTKIWVKLSHDAISILDKFYRDLEGGSATRTSPFNIFCKHRFIYGYYEFYKYEYDQIFKNMRFDHEILTPNEMIALCKGKNPFDDPSPIIDDEFKTEYLGEWIE